MSNLPVNKQDAVALEQVLLKGDLSQLTPDQRVSYYKKVCESLGLNPVTKPFEFIELNRKLVLYATRACTEQLRQIHQVSLNITSREVLGDIYVVTARAKTAIREDESTGAVNIKGLSGDNLANAYMKAETKAKRRVTLSICGLAFLDESEAGSIPGAKLVHSEPIAHVESTHAPERPAISAQISESVLAEAKRHQNLHKDLRKESQFAKEENSIEKLAADLDAEIVDDRKDWVIPSGSLEGTKLSDKTDAFWGKYLLDLESKIDGMPQQFKPAAILISKKLREYLGEELS